MRFLILGCAGLMLAGAAQAATIVNGSFENGTFTSAGFDTLSAGNTSMTGWTIGGSGVDWIGNFWQRDDGNRSVDLSALSVGSVSQTFATDIGKRYVVTFALAGNPTGAPNIKVVNVMASGNAAQSFDFTTGGTTTAANMGWVDRTYSFIAGTSSTTLSFASTINTPSGPALDNVRISAVPEAATWAMLIAGFGMVGAVARRRRHTILA